MILNNAPQAEAVMSNVGEIGEFRIRNSAKAFNILSSGLYANKIRAIIRELSCNAVDSHAAAGCVDRAFDVHLPTTLEPYFSIRDYGTGLSHDQVTNIYTTYFESTKTASNEFIGALGLGSKSPFSYTDNFTVIAIKDGRRGIYTAFINESGVPSIALMHEDQVTESNGVEVKFSVVDRFDFGKFADEARNVYKWFKQQPNITGNVVSIPTVEYESKDIVPGVHSVPNANRSYAVMGNIAYPIDVPSKEKNLEGVHQLLSCGLVIEFKIGELDFQASREGLSYIPQTIESIRKKLVELNSALTDVIAKEADAITCEWTRSQFLYDKHQLALWKSAAIDYAQKTNFALFKSNGAWSREYRLKLYENDLKNLNIRISGFTTRRGEKACGAIKQESEYIPSSIPGAPSVLVEYVTVDVSKNVFFVANDTKIGGLDRAKYHFRNNEDKNMYVREVFVLSKIDKTKDMKLNEFYAMIHNPPMDQRMILSTMDEKPRVNTGNGLGKNISILRLEARGGSGWHQRSHDLVWRDGGKIADFDDSQTYYYIPLSGFVAQMNIVKHWSVHDLVSTMRNTKMAALDIEVYGVRKGDIKEIESKSNWVNLEKHLMDELTALQSKVDTATAISNVDTGRLFEYNFEKLLEKIDVKSPAAETIKTFVGLPKLGGLHHVRQLFSIFGFSSTKLNVDALTVKYQDMINNFNKRYPLIDYMNSSAKEIHIAEYITVIDQVKGV